MDWLYVLMPISGVTIFWPGLIILGLGVGIIGGFFGMGGAWMVTPGLNILGFPMAFAVGTDVAHMAGKSLISTLRHGKFGNVDYKLGLTMLVGTIVGVELGAQMLMWLERLGSVDKVVRWLYVVLLICMAWMVFHDVALRKKKEREAAARGEELSATATGIDWASKLHAIRIPPMVHFHGAGIYCSAWLPIAVSLFTGWLAGILGIGGGLIRMPALVYLVGCPTHVAVGTDLFEVAISGLYGAASFTFKGRTEPHHAGRCRHRCPDRCCCHQVHQGLRHPYRLRLRRHRLPRFRGPEAHPALLPRLCRLHQRRGYRGGSGLRERHLPLHHRPYGSGRQG